MDEQRMIEVITRRLRVELVQAIQPRLDHFDNRSRTYEENSRNFMIKLAEDYTQAIEQLDGIENKLDNHLNVTPPKDPDIIREIKGIQEAVRKLAADKDLAAKVAEMDADLKDMKKVLQGYIMKSTTPIKDPDIIKRFNELHDEIKELASWL